MDKGSLKKSLFKRKNKRAYNHNIPDNDITLQVSCKEQLLNKNSFSKYLNENINEDNNESYDKDIWEKEKNVVAEQPINSLYEAILNDAPMNIIRYWIKVEEKEINKKRGKFHDTSLHIAAKNGNLEIIFELLKHGADVSISNSRGQKPLHFAAQSGKLKVVQAVKYNIDSQDICGRTSLHNAAELGHMDICSWLIKKGARTLLDNNYTIAADLALENNHHKLAEWLYKIGGTKIY